MDILPCKKCGSAAGTHMAIDDRRGVMTSWYVDCRNFATCEDRSKGAKYATKKEAVAAWNKEQE